MLLITEILSAMFITNIERLPRKKNRIYIDDEYAFMLYDRDLTAYGLDRCIVSDSQDTFETDMDIPDRLFEKIMKETVLRRAHQKAVALLERMDRSETELRRRLKLDMYSESVTDETIAWLKSRHFLDDARFAESYIRGHIESSSRQELTSRLLAKGVPKEVINSAYDACCEELSFSPADGSPTYSGSTDPAAGNAEKLAAVKTLRKKLGSGKNLTPKERMNVIGYMLRKGFRRNDIMSAFDELEIVIGYDDIPE